MSRLYDALQNAYADQGPARAAARLLQGRQDGLPPSADGEILRLYQAFEAALAQRPRRVVQIVGAEHEVGTTSVCTRLGRLAANAMGQSVLVLNAASQPMARPARMRLATVAEGAGPASSHQPGEPTPPRMIVGNLHDHAGDTALLNPRSLRHCWERLREQYEWVILDSPPVAESPLAQALAPTVDGVALVLAAERTRYGTAAAARDALLDSGANLLGVVLNQRRRYLPRFLERLGV